MRDRHIVAMGGGGFSMDDPVLDRYVVEVCGVPDPRICFVGTASGDAVSYRDGFLEAFPAWAFDPTTLDLFERTVDDVDAFLGEQDVIYVGGGSTANLLAVWRVHGVDRALRAAWEAGVVLAGISAGANCWFEASTTDSFLQGGAEPLLDGLRLVQGSFCPHYDGEPERRPRYRQLIGDGTLPPGIACDDFAAVHLVGTAVHAVVASRGGAGAYRVTSTGDGVREEPMDVVRLPDP